MKKLQNFYVKEHEQHPFHLVDPSPWPLMTSLSIYSIALGFVMWFQKFSYGDYHLIIGILSLSWNLYRWFSDIIMEATFEGFHTFKVQENILLGMSLFIASEVMFFFSFFWAFFHFSLTPSIWIGGVWPPMGIHALDPQGVPLFNTALLLMSGVSVTWAHHAVQYGNRSWALAGIFITILKAMLFTTFQFLEYCGATFSINDGVYGSIFYMTTGFHGLHVIVGTIFLMVCFFRQMKGHFFKRHHTGFVCAIWYWHFVDVVWVFLYICVYIWGA